MDLPDIGRLPDDLAAAADGVIGSVIATTARVLSFIPDRDVDETTAATWAALAADAPQVYALAVLRLKETGNEEMLLLATREVLE